MNRKKENVYINLKHYVNQRVLLILLLIFIIAMFSNPAYAKTSVEWLDEGDLLFEEGDYSSAIEAYDRAISIDPADAYTWNMKGLTLGLLGRYEEAIGAYDKAIGIDSEYAYAWTNKGLAFDSLGRYEEAIEAYDRAISIDPADAYTWTNKGLTLDSLGRYEEAIETYDKAIGIDSEYAYAWYNKGLTLESLERYDEAKEAHKIAEGLYLSDDIVNILLSDIAIFSYIIIFVLFLFYFLKKSKKSADDTTTSTSLKHTEPKKPSTSKPAPSPQLKNKDLNQNNQQIIKTDDEIIKDYSNTVATILLASFILSIVVMIFLFLINEWLGLSMFLMAIMLLVFGILFALSNPLQLKINKVLNKKNHPNEINEPSKANRLINTTSAFGYKGATIIHKIKIENPTSEPIGDIKIHLFVPDVFLLENKEKSISMLEPNESKTVTFEIRPTGECGDCNVSGRLNYYDYGTKKRKEIDLETKSLSVVCPILKIKDIPITEWRNITSHLVRTEETTRDISIPAETLFNMASRVIEDMNMFVLEPEIVSTPQMYNGVAKFYGVGVKDLNYAAQIEVVGGTKKSKLILKAWAEREDALTGFYHGILDELEKRVQVKGYIDDSIVQNFYHHGDNIGTQVKDSFVQRSNIGTGAKKCQNCGREVEAGEKFCHECGAKLRE